jgi:polyvinyl alcohol dehydrogenase (cytochrome)
MRRLVILVSLCVISVWAYVTLTAPTPRSASTNTTIPAQAFCAPDRSTFDKPFDVPYWNGWGVGPENRRSQSAAIAGLLPDQIPHLKLKWAFGVPGAGAIAQPTVAGGRLFFGSSTGKVYSIDAASGCIYWTFDAQAQVRTAITVGPIGGAWATYFGDTGASGAHLFAVDAATGRLLWKTTVESFPAAHITGAPTLAAGKLFVPITGHEDVLADNPRYPCCRLRGSLAALDAATGALLWKTYTIAEEPKPFRENANGVTQWGPSGVGIWSAPTVDLAAHAVYAATGDAHSDPPASTSDSILAFNIDTGALLWSRQTIPGDTFNASCVGAEPANCPEIPGPDFDFAASPILVDLPGGKRALIAAQKSGVVYALDPDQQGRIVWQSRIGKGGPGGGIMFGPAADGRAAFVALSDVPNVFSPNVLTSGPFKALQTLLGRNYRRMEKRFVSDAGGGMFALQLDTGKTLWHTPPQCEPGEHCQPGQMAAVTNIPGIAFSGSVDGHIRAYATDTGRVIWKAATNRDFTSVDGVYTHGGSLDGPGPVVAGGILYMSSGYAAPRGIPGNALLAFTIDGR